MVRRVSTTPALLREKFGEGMKGLTSVRGDDVLCGSQLVSLDVFRTDGKKRAPGSTSGSLTKWKLTPLSRQVQSVY